MKRFLDRSGTAPSSQAMAFLLVLLVAITYVALAASHTRAFSSDSWSYLDLSQTIFGDFYRPSTVRSFGENAGYSRSFPLLWPVAIAVANRVTNWGASTLPFLAAAAGLAIVIPVWIIAHATIRRRAVARLAAVVLWASILLSVDFIDEVQAGRSIPAALLLLLSGVAVAVRRDDDRPIDAILFGLLLGLAALTRFDVVPIVGVLLLCFISRRRVRVSVRIVAVVAFVATVSPWLVYSLRHYHTPWASDNTQVALAAVQRDVTDYRVPAATIRTDPRRWLVRVARNVPSLIASFQAALLVFPGSILALAALAGCWPRRWRASAQVPAIKWLAMSVMASLAALASLAVTGYFDARYFIYVCAFVTITATLFVLRTLAPVRLAVRLALAFSCIAALPRAISVVRRASRAAEPSSISSQDRQWARGALIERHVVLDFSGHCFEFGAVTRVRTVCPPPDWSSLSDAERRQLVLAYHVTDVRGAPETTGAEPTIRPIGGVGAAPWEIR